MKNLYLKKLEGYKKLHNSLMKRYTNLVTPHGFGYNIPASTSKAATEILEQCSEVRERIDKMHKFLGIKKEEKKPPPNAKVIGKIFNLHNPEKN